jgi:lipid A 3-O-deacylase
MKKILLSAVSLGLLTSTAALADEGRSDYLTVGAGQFDFIDGDEESTIFALEYRASPVWNVIGADVRPMVGINYTTDGTSYGYGGFNFDFKVGDGMYISPNAAVGAYSNGDGKDIGDGLEFRTGVEFAYQCASGNRIGLAINHISNANTKSDNPGTETIMATYSLPFGSVFGK